MLFNLPVTRRSRRRLRLALEGLETRALLSGFSPSAIEQVYLEELDDARFNPAAYGASLGLDLSNIAPSQPLAMNTLLVEAARLHSQDMIARNYFAHVSPEGVGPAQRIQAAGFDATGYAESIETNTNYTPKSQPFPTDYAAQDSVSSLADLVVDQGVADLGHRVMLLDIGGQFHADRQLGIGIATQDGTDSTGQFLSRLTDTTIDLASTTDSDPFLTGVVFQDSAGNGKYEPGEGLSGVTITVANAGSTTTLDAGGYSLQLPPGTYTVTASGGGLPAPITRTVVLGQDNVRLNFDEDPNGATLNAASDGSVGGSLGSFAAFQSGDSPSSYSAWIDWGDGHTSVATLIPNGKNGFDVDGSNSYAPSGVFAVRVLITHLSDGQTLALNTTVGVNSPVSPTPTSPSPTSPTPTSPTPTSPTPTSPGPTSPGGGSSNAGQGPGTNLGPGHKAKKHTHPKPHPHPKPKAHPHPHNPPKPKIHPVQTKIASHHRHGG
jgi:uncharacterized protein YkwD